MDLKVAMLDFPIYAIENKFVEHKKTFHYAYRPLANGMCFGGHQISVPIGGGPCTVRSN